jgi:hypothetical protein
LLRKEERRDTGSGHPRGRAPGRQLRRVTWRGAAIGEEEEEVAGDRGEEIRWREERGEEIRWRERREIKGGEMEKRKNKRRTCNFTLRNSLPTVILPGSRQRLFANCH